MKMKLKVENPFDIEMSLTTTMKLKDWIELLRQLKHIDVFPSTNFRTEIAKMIDIAEKHFYSEPE